MAWDQDLESEVAFEPSRFCTHGKTEVVEEYFLLLAAKVDGGMNPAFRIQILNESGFVLTCFVWVFFCQKKTILSREAGNLPHGVARKQHRGMCVLFVCVSLNIMDPRLHSG